MAKKALPEPVSYSLREAKAGEVLVLNTVPDTVERYLVLMETTHREAAELLRLNLDPENLEKRYWDSFRADRKAAVEEIDRLWGSIQRVRSCRDKGDSDTALMYMFDAVNSYRKVLDNDYIEQLRNTDKATDARKKEKPARRARLKKYAKANGNPPPIPSRKDRTAWIRQFIDAEVSSGNKKVEKDTIRADLRFLHL